MPVDRRDALGLYCEDAGFQKHLLRALLLLDLQALHLCLGSSCDRAVLPHSLLVFLGIQLLGGVAFPSLLLREETHSPEWDFLPLSRR